MGPETSNSNVQTWSACFLLCPEMRVGEVSAARMGEAMKLISRIAAAVCVVGVSYGTGTVARKYRQANALPPVPEARLTVEATDLRDDGNQSRIGLGLLPRAIQGSAGASLEYVVELVNRAPRASVATIALELVTDSGKQVASVSKVSNLQFSAGATKIAVAYPIPALPDGFYSLRATCAMADSDTSEVAISSEHFVIQNGLASPMSIPDWYHASAANVASPFP